MKIIIEIGDNLKDVLDTIGTEQKMVVLREMLAKIEVIPNDNRGENNMLSGRK